MKDPQKTKIIFMGTSTFAAKILEGMLEKKYDVRAIYTQSPKKSGRNQTPPENPVEKIAKEKKIELFSPENFDDSEASRLKSFSPDLLVVASYGKILPKSILEISEKGCLNIHASLLPKYRGPSPIQNAILEGEKETGVTVMLMNEGVDTGDILSSKKIEVGKDELFPQIQERLSLLGKDLLLETIPLFLEKKITSVPQDKNQATLCQLIEREDGRIIWSDDAKEIYDRYRAFYSWPGIYSFWEKDDRALRLKFKKISIFEGKIDKSTHLGEVFLDGEKMCVAAEGGAIVVEEIQIEGKNSSSAKDFLNGHPDIAGVVLK